VTKATQWFARRGQATCDGGTRLRDHKEESEDWLDGAHVGRIQPRSKACCVAFRFDLFVEKGELGQVLLWGFFFGIKWKEQGFCTRIHDVFERTRFCVFWCTRESLYRRFLICRLSQSGQRE